MEVEDEGLNGELQGKPRAYIVFFSAKKSAWRPKSVKSGERERLGAFEVLFRWLKGGGLGK